MSDLESEKKKDHCLKAGIEFNTLMTGITGDVAAEAMGVKMVKEQDKVTATISEEASKTYTNPKTDRLLGEILDDIKDNCKGILPIEITKSDGEYTVIQRLKRGK